MPAPAAGGPGALRRDLLGSAEAEADAAHRVQVARARGVVAELAAQPADVRVERLRRAEPVLVPHARHQVLADHGPAGGAHQLRQQVELLAREVDGLVAKRPLPRAEVDLALADRDRL